MTTPAAPSILSFRPSDAVQRVLDTSLRVQQPQSGGDLVSLAMGEPDFDTPQQVRDAAAKALQDGHTHYSPLLGEPALRDELAVRIGGLLGSGVSANDVLITQGGTAGLAAAILGTVNPGDKVVIPDPTYSLYADLVSMAGGTIVPVPLAEDLHWDLEALAGALHGAKMFVFCNPSNPTGIVHSRAELEALAASSPAPTSWCSPMKPTATWSTRRSRSHLRWKSRALRTAPSTARPSRRATP